MQELKHPNQIEFQVTGDYAMFSDPVTRMGGEKCSYQVPPYEAIKGIMASILWKPTLILYPDAVRIMEPIQTEAKGMRPLVYQPKKKGVISDLSYYTYLKRVRYQVRGHFEWNYNRPEMANDRNARKYREFFQRMIEKGGRRDIFLGTRECQGYVEPCVFGDGVGAYDNIPELSFGLMLHGMTYPDEAYSKGSQGMLTSNFWYPVMRNGIITFPRPEDCPFHKPVRKMTMKTFSVPEKHQEVI